MTRTRFSRSRSRSRLHDRSRDYNNSRNNARNGNYKSSGISRRGTEPGMALKKPHWESIRLQPFKKNFHKPHRNVDYRSKSEIEDFLIRKEITVQGRNVPKPVFTLEEVGFPEKILIGLKKQGFKYPTPIQAQGWPIALSGQNLVGIAATGSGKTLAYIIPALIHIMAQETLRKGNGPIALILSPTRELAQQIQQVTTDMGDLVHINNTCVFGGSPKSDQISALRRGAEIVIATPGRLLDLLETGDTDLRSCTYFVLDEADRMLDMGFERQIKKIIEQIRPDRQVLMCSATWPKEVRNLAESFLREYTQINIGSLQLSANHNITQVVDVCQENEKEEKLIRLLKQTNYRSDNKTIVFIATKRKVDEITKKVLREGFNAICIHGDKKQTDREYALKDFRNGKSSILIATDVAARGLDVEDVKYVINYDFPKNPEDYVHRIGRTGRCTKTGTSFTFFTRKNSKQASTLISVLREANQKINPKLEEFAEHYRLKNRKHYNQGRSKSNGTESSSETSSSRSRSTSVEIKKTDKKKRSRSLSSHDKKMKSKHLKKNVTEDELKKKKEGKDKRKKKKKSLSKSPSEKKKKTKLKPVEEAKTKKSTSPELSSEDSDSSDESSDDTSSSNEEETTIKDQENLTKETINEKHKENCNEKEITKTIESKQKSSTPILHENKGVSLSPVEVHSTLFNRDFKLSTSVRKRSSRTPRRSRTKSPIRRSVSRRSHSKQLIRNRSRSLRRSRSKSLIRERTLSKVRPLLRRTRSKSHIRNRSRTPRRRSHSKSIVRHRSSSFFKPRNASSIQKYRMDEPRSNPKYRGRRSRSRTFVNRRSRTPTNRRSRLRSPRLNTRYRISSKSRTPPNYNRPRSRSHSLRNIDNRNKSKYKSRSRTPIRRRSRSKSRSATPKKNLINRIRNNSRSVSRRNSRGRISGRPRSLTPIRKNSGDRYRDRRRSTSRSPIKKEIPLGHRDYRHSRSRSKVRRSRSPVARREIRLYSGSRSPIRNREGFRSRTRTPLRNNNIRNREYRSPPRKDTFFDSRPRRDSRFRSRTPIRKNFPIPSRNRSRSSEKIKNIAPRDLRYGTTSKPTYRRRSRESVRPFVFRPRTPVRRDFRRTTSRTRSPGYNTQRIIPPNNDYNRRPRSPPDRLIRRPPPLKRSSSRKRSITPKRRYQTMAVDRKFSDYSKRETSTDREKSHHHHHHKHHHHHHHHCRDSQKHRRSDSLGNYNRSTSRHSVD